MAAGLNLQEDFSVQPPILLLILLSVLLRLFSSTHIPLFLFPAYLLNTRVLNYAARMSLLWGVTVSVEVE